MFLAVHPPKGSKYPKVKYFPKTCIAIASTRIQRTQPLGTWTLNPKLQTLCINFIAHHCHHALLLSTVMAEKYTVEEGDPWVSTTNHPVKVRVELESSISVCKDKAAQTDDDQTKRLRYQLNKAKHELPRKEQFWDHAAG